MKERGMALMAPASPAAANRAADAAHKAISSPSWKTSPSAAPGHPHQHHLGPRNLHGRIEGDLRHRPGRSPRRGHHQVGPGLGRKPRRRDPGDGHRHRHRQATGSRTRCWSQAAAAGTPPEDLEIPTILRTEPPPARGAEAAKNGAKKPLGVVAQKKFIVHPDLAYEENELDTPPFLRKAD